MSSDIINYFKIENYLNTTVLNNLKSTFKERWSSEYNTQWKNGVESGNLIKENLKQLNGNFNKDEISLIEKGNSNKFTISILCDLLLKLNFKNDYNNQNEKIRKIKEINDKVKGSDFKISLESFNSFKQVLSKNSIGVNSSNQEDDDDGDVSCGADSNLKNENEANQLFEKGLNSLNSKSFEQARKSFVHALGFEDISKSIKSQLYYNCGLSKFEQYNRYCSYEGITNIEFPEDKFSLFEESKSDVLLAIVYKPSWYIPYVLYGKILSKLSNYPLSISFFKAALSLVESSSLSSIQSNKKSIVEEINSLINESMDKLKLKINLSKENGGRRNFNKENEIKIEKIGNLVKENKSQFKSVISGEFLKKYGINTSKRAECIKIAESFGLPKQLYVEIEMVNKAYDYYKEGDIGKSLEICQNMVGCQTQYCQAYLNLSNIYRFKIPKSNNSGGNGKSNSLGIEYNPKMVLTLHLLGSLCPIKFEIPQYLSKTYSQAQMDEISENQSVGEIFTYLGLIYQYGLLNEDIDYEKSIHYFKLAIENFNDKVAYSNLGQLYFKGRVPDGKPNYEIAKKIWERGSNYEYKECIDLLKSKFKISKEAENENQKQMIKPIEFKSSNNIYKGINYFEIENYENEQSFNYNFNEVLNQVSDRNLTQTRINYIINNANDFVREFENGEKDNSNNNISNNSNKNKNKNKNNSNGNNSSNNNSYSIEFIYKTLKPLTNSYIVAKELFYLVQLPKEKLKSIKEYINQLLFDISSSNGNQYNNEIIKMVRICYLGINRFNYELLDSNIEFVNQSLKLFKNDRDFFYYSCVFNIYKNDYTNVYCNSSNIIKTIPKDIINSREIFLYYKTLSSNFELFEDGDLQDNFKNQLLNEISKDALEFINCDNFETKLKNEKNNNNNKNKNNSNNELILYSPFIIDFYSLVSFSFYLLSINNNNNNNYNSEDSGNNNSNNDINNYKLSIEYYNLACNYNTQLKNKLQLQQSDKENQLLSKQLYIKRLDYLDLILNNLKKLLNL